MEVPRHWREMPTNVSFTGREKNTGDSGLTVFKFPGGEIPLVGSLEQIKERFERRGFNEKDTEEILFSLFYAVATEAAIPVGEIQKSFFELIRSEVRK